jgi:hypothetical protein
MATRKKKPKKLAVVASGWHFPLSFYRNVSAQVLPKGWEMELFCVSHRDPSAAAEEKRHRTFGGPRADLDERLYDAIATVGQIKDLGWDYREEPNTVGDWGNSNQWLDRHDYEDYDLLLFTHDDNLILNDVWFSSIIEDGAFEDWGICANSEGMPKGWLRGSCEFFKPWVIRKLGGKFDLSEVTLSMEGKTTVGEELNALYDWNKTVDPLMRAIEKIGVPIGMLSDSYRVSAFVIEGERGYISNTHGENTAVENEGLKYLRANGII